MSMTTGTVHGNCKHCGQIAEPGKIFCSKDCATLEHRREKMRLGQEEEIGRLVLGRRFGQGIVIDGKITVCIERKCDNQVKVVIYAPKSVQVDRLECTNLKLPKRFGA